MKHEEREAQGSQFKGQCTQFSISMKMSDSSSLLIQVEDTISPDRWKKVIDKKFIESQMQTEMLYGIILAEPQLIFDYISENFSEVSFKPNLFQFVYSYGTTKNKKTKIMTIPLEKEEISSISLINLRIDRLRHEFAEKLTQRDAKIKQLEEQNTKMDQLLQKLTEKVVIIENKQGIYNLNADGSQLSTHIIEKQQIKNEVRQNIVESIERNNRLQEQCQILKQRLGKQQDKVKELKQSLNTKEENFNLLLKTQKAANDILAQQVQFLKEQQISSNKFIIQPQIDHHMGNAHRHYFALNKSSANSAKIERVKGGPNYYNFICKHELSTKRHSKYTVKIIKASSNEIMIGLCTDKGLGSLCNYDSTESTYYYSHGDGRLYEGGIVKYLSGCGSVNGEVIEYIVDLLEGRQYWWKGGKVLLQCAIPAAMLGKPVYFSMIIRFEGDSVDLSII